MNQMKEMKRVHGASVFVLGVVVVLLLVGCTSAADVAEMGCWSEFKDSSDPASFTNRCGFDAGAGTQSAALHLRISLLQGSMTWTLKDPDGRVCQSGRVEAGQDLDEQYRVKVLVPGKWWLELEVEDVVGEYDADWRVQ